MMTRPSIRGVPSGKLVPHPSLLLFDLLLSFLLHSLPKGDRPLIMLLDQLALYLPRERLAPPPLGKVDAQLGVSLACELVKLSNLVYPYLELPRLKLGFKLSNEGWRQTFGPRFSIVADLVVIR